MKQIDPFTGWRRFYRSRETTLYYITFTHKGKDYYKLGITTVGISERFKRDNIKCKLLWSQKFKSGESAYKKEQRLLHKFISHLYTGPPILKGGNSEILVKDILKELKCKS